MRRRLTGPVLASLATAALLSGCAADQPATVGSTTSQGVASSIAETTGDPAAEATGCVTLARIDWQGERVGVADEVPVATGIPVDSGPRDGAAGVAKLDADGRLIGYTVAAGDSPSVIQDRFCIDGLSVLHYNGYWVTGDGKDIAPGDYLSFVPDPAIVYLGPDL